MGARPGAPQGESAAPGGRGALKIFLGAAPGVGKTFAMLEAAHERRREGTDVVVGVADTHGRPEAQALVEPLEVVPQRRIEHRGHAFFEMDLQAILQRRPQIALVDELAHPNAPGSQHSKRYQDVEALLEAGIDVYSTLNIQHLESLNDIVERIAGVKVRDTLPDSVLHGADEIELVDLAPDDLLKRLAEGRVYVPEQARRSMHHFFSRGNLNALREIALRQAAERVDAQMRDYMRAHAVEGPWPTHERLLVAVGHDADAARLVRAGKRVAERRGGAPWTVVHVESERHHLLPEDAKDRLAQALRLAEQLGGEARTLPGSDVAEEILAYARDHNITLIVVGRSHAAGRRWIARTSAAEQVLSRAGGVDVLVVGGEEDQPRRPAVWDRSAAPRTGWLAYATAVAGVAAATGACWMVGSWLPLPSIAVAYLLMVLVVAIRLGLRPAILASIASFLAFNFFFTEPKFTLAVSDAQNTLTLLFFLAAAFITSNLAGRVRTQMQAIRLSARRTATLYEFSRKIASAASQDDVLWAVVHHVAAAIRGRSLVLLPKGERLEICAGYPPEDQLDDADMDAALLAWTRGVPVGRGTATLPTASWVFLPMQTARANIGVLGVQLDAAGDWVDGAHGALPPETSRLLEALADQAALALERTALVADVETARVSTEAERLRTGLLSSLSHELRMPILGILEAAGRLAVPEEPSPAARQELATFVQDEARRLDRFVRNLQGMTRLGADALSPHTDWTELRAVLEAALDRARRLLRGRDVRIDIPTDLPRLSLDRALIEQVFFNLIDNACRHTPPASRITIWARARGAHVLIEVVDEGPGIPEDEREKVFDMFYRMDGAGGSPAAGLGLAVCRSIIAAHGGDIRVAGGLNEVGTAILIRLPIAPSHDRQNDKAPR